MRIFYPSKKIRQCLGVIVISFLIFLCMGCQGVQPALKPSEMKADMPAKLTLGPGDVLEIRFFYNPELNDSQTVRPDGKITLQLVGEVAVQGKTPEELRGELKQLFALELRKPEVTVIVRSLFDRRVYVGGEVRTPGLILVPGRMTALEAIMQAGGFDMRAANLNNVVIIRHKDGKRYGCALNFKEILQGKEGQLFYLEPQDIVYVPRTDIVKVNQWIDQYINKIIPRTGFVLSYPMGAGTITLDTSTAIAVP